ncbi:hypothetical protein BDD12DRAFT_855947 [Trichophaea hybrida]|nr:hypothetical protein BDD12DRAFT_855947 [Trichophaea hybrida]
MLSVLRPRGSAGYVKIRQVRHVAIRSLNTPLPPLVVPSNPYRTTTSAIKPANELYEGRIREWPMFLNTVRECDEICKLRIAATEEEETTITDSEVAVQARFLDQVGDVVCNSLKVVGVPVSVRPSCGRVGRPAQVINYPIHRDRGKHLRPTPDFFVMECDEQLQPGMLPGTLHGPIVPIVVGEVKTDSTEPAIYTIGVDQVPLGSLSQVLSYMDQFTTNFGLLTTYNDTICIRRVREFFEYSPTLRAYQTSPSVRECLAYIILVAMRQKSGTGAGLNAPDALQLLPPHEKDQPCGNFPTAQTPSDHQIKIATQERGNVWMRVHTCIGDEMSSFRIQGAIEGMAVTAELWPDNNAVSRAEFEKEKKLRMILKDFLYGEFLPARVLKGESLGDVSNGAAIMMRVETKPEKLQLLDEKDIPQAKQFLYRMLLKLRECGLMMTGLRMELLRRTTDTNTLVMVDIDRKQILHETVSVARLKKQVQGTWRNWLEARKRQVWANASSDAVVSRKLSRDHHRRLSTHRFILQRQLPPFKQLPPRCRNRRLGQTFGGGGVFALVLCPSSYSLGSERIRW